MKLDIEGFITALETHLKAATVGLNAKITLIDAEKSVAVMSQISTAGYFKQIIGDRALNEDPLCVIGIEDIESVTAGSHVGKTYTVGVYIIFELKADEYNFERMTRYHRSIEESLADGFDKIRKSARVQIKSMAPVAIEIKTDAQPQIAVGVQLEVTLI